MPRQVLIFGNGLGRSLDNEAFQLRRAMIEVWNDAQGLNDRQKRLIERCMQPDVFEQVPTEEEQLADLQEIVAACDRILQAEVDTDQGWLSDEGKEFPAAIRSYVHRIACKFHNIGRLPEEFSQPLRDFILSSRSHVATLNYDDLLYRAFLHTPVMEGYRCLNDGFLNAQFNKSNLTRRFNIDQKAWYLHLHGSPLYHETAAGVISKANLARIDLIQGDSSGHIVLTSKKHKTNIIEASDILTEYWRCLKEAIAESNTITLFGYGGGDDHLNDLVKLAGKAVRIVERGADPYQARQTYWQSKIGDNQLIHLNNILEFRDW